MLTSFASHLTTATKCNPWIRLSWLRSNLGRVITVYQIDKQFDNAYKPAARGEIAANGFRPTGRFPCDKNIYRPHDFPLASEGTDAAPVNQPALVKTSDQTLCSSVSICHSLLPMLLSIRYQPCAKSGPTAKYMWWNRKENNEFALQKICWSKSEKKIKLGSKSKTSQLP